MIKLIEGNLYLSPRLQQQPRTILKATFNEQNAREIYKDGFKEEE